MSPLEAEAIFGVISQYRDHQQNLTDCFYLLQEFYKKTKIVTNGMK